MDRRYSQARFYNGTPASNRSNQRSEALVKRYLGAARKANADAQSYGGSTGGASSPLGQAAGAATASARGVDLGKIRESFKTYGSGAIGARGLGGRASLAELRGYRRASSDQANGANGIDSTGLSVPSIDQP